MKYRDPTMLGPKAKESYKQLVRYYKYINNTTRIDNYLDSLFDKALSDLKLIKHHSVCATSKPSSQITLDQAKAIKKLDYLHGINTWTDIVKSKIMIPLLEFNNIISESFNVTSRDSIKRHQVKLLELLNLKQIRKGNNHYVVHRMFKTSNNKSLTEFKEFEKDLRILIKKVHKKGSIPQDEIIANCISAKMKKTFDEIIDDYNISIENDYDKYGWKIKKYVSTIRQTT